jgi:hypothetical protein
MRIPAFLAFFLFPGLFAIAQKPNVEILTTGTKTSLRGLSVVNDNVVWVSGSNGMVGRSNNAGKNWNWYSVKGYEKTEFRDIEAFDAQNAVIMAVGEPAYILKTSDGGISWDLVYENKAKGMFLDALDFWDDENGVVVGDPIDGKVFIAQTKDGGSSWTEVTRGNLSLRADSGEAFFAASGTNIRYFKNKFFLVSGGSSSRLFTNEEITRIPVKQGAETRGANSIAVFDDGSGKGSRKLIVVGGDFNNATSRDSVCAYSSNGGKSWKLPLTPPQGYRSCVEYLSPTDLLTCGLNGVDFSSNSGRDWQPLSNEGFNVCRISKYGHAIYLAGNNGKIAKITWY